MARPRPTLSTSRPRPRPTSESAASDDVPWRKVPGVVRLTTQILAAHERGSTRRVQEVVAIGQRILEVKRLLRPGSFLAWSREALPIGERTVQRWLSLAIFADEEPDELSRFSHLGPAKLYRIATLPPGPRGKLKLRTPMPIPGTDETKTIEVMTRVELERAIGGLATPRVPRTPIDKIVQSYRFRLAGLSVLTDELRTRAKDVDRSLASELAAELHGLAEALEATFSR